MVELGVSRADQLARIEQAGLIRQGRVFLLSLQPIRDEMGPRWSGRADQVWETLERTLTRRMPLPDVFIRIDDVTVLAAVASVEPYEGQVRCAEALKSTLGFFLGRSNVADVGLSRVSDITGGRLTAEAVDVAAPPPPCKVGPSTRAPGGKPPERWTPPLAGRRYEGQFDSDRRGSVHVAFDIAPVWRLDQGTISAFVIRRRLPAPLKAFSDYDREAMDRLLVDHLIPLLIEYREHGGVFALIIPGSFSSASARRPRAALIDRCAPVLDVMRQAVILQIEGFGDGTPSGRVREMAAMMKPFFHVLTACVDDMAGAEAALCDFAFHGMAIEARGMGRLRLERLVAAARRQTPNVVVHGLARGVDVASLRKMGASHVSYVDVEQSPPGAAAIPSSTAV